jgi:hypothetical protein
MICLRSAAYCLCREKSLLFHEHVRLTNVDVKTQPCVATFSGEKSSGAGIIMQRPEAASIYQTAPDEDCSHGSQSFTTCHTHGDKANSRDMVVKLHNIDNYPLSYIAWAAMSQLDPVNHSNRCMQLSSQDIVYVYPMIIHNPPSVDTHLMSTSTVPSQTHIHVMVEFIRHKSPSKSV